MIIGCSGKKDANPEPLRAIYRYQGQYWQTLKKYLSLASHIPLMIAFSAQMGFINVKTFIPMYDEVMGNIPNIDLFRSQWIAKVAPQVEVGSSVFIAVGLKYRKIMDVIGAFETLNERNATVIIPIRGILKTRGMLRDWLIKE